MQISNTSEIKKLAASIRRDVIEMTYHAKSGGGHIGGALSSADIFAVLYGGQLNVSPNSVEDENRDRFILSKGHVALGLYAALAERGFISRDEMLTFEDSGGSFPTHTYMNIKKGIETSSGSLGYGLSISVGIALAARRKKRTYQVYTLLGDGECNEGTVWEAAMSAGHYKLDNITAIVDINGQQNDGYVHKVMTIDSISTVFKGFGWDVVSVDGNDVEELVQAFDRKKVGKPKVILANTVKAKGIASIEGKEGWHHTRLGEEQYIQFLRELGEQR